MRLHSIRITNFRSFKGEQSFHFPGKPGLYFMQGVNALEPRLEANGSGKSTIWEALLWCFFAKTSRGLKAGDVCNWDVDKGTKVELDFSLDERTLWTVTRTWKPNSWTLSHIADHITDEEVVDLTKSESNHVLDWLAVEFMPFLHCILMAQSQPMFLDLKHDQQAALFSEVLGLDHWIDYSSAASKRASTQDIETRRLERALAEVIGRINGQKDFTGSVEEFEAKRKKQIEEFDGPYSSKLDQLRVLKVTEEEAIALEKRRREALIEARAKLETIMDKEVKPAQELAELIRRDLGKAEDRLDAAVNHLERLKKETDCPTCKRPLDRQNHKLHVDEARADMIARQQLADKLQRQFADADAVMEALNKSNTKVLEAFGKAQNALSDAEQSVRTQRAAVLRIEKELDDIEYQVERIEKEVNPFIDVQAKMKEEGKLLRAERDELQDKLDASVEKQSLYSFWVRGFKELRLQLIAEALTELEIEVNSCVTALGLVNWELRFQVDRETKGGSVQRGFSVEVVSPASTKPTPWEAWSGGESQRLRLAATMGLSNLIRSRMGVELDLEVWDEPSTALSPQGVKDLLEALEHRAQQEQRVVWIVDHTAHAFGGFAGGATITKTRKGSQISQY